MVSSGSANWWSVLESASRRLIIHVNTQTFRKTGSTWHNSLTRSQLLSIYRLYIYMLVIRSCWSISYRQTALSLRNLEVSLRDNLLRTVANRFGRRGFYFILNRKSHMGSNWSPTSPRYVGWIVFDVVSGMWIFVFNE